VKCVINLNELSGVTLRNALNASRVRMSYHNKHKDGSGNFGFVIVFEHEGVKDAGCGITVPNETWFQLSGSYNAQKEIYSLDFGDYARPIGRIPRDFSFGELKTYMEITIAQVEDAKIKSTNQ
jgi:hypothetical protein